MRISSIRSVAAVVLGLALCSGSDVFGQTPYPASVTLANAINLAAQAGYLIPTGWFVEFSDDISGLGHADHKRQVLQISPAALDAYVPNLTDPANQLPGLVSVVLIHEIQHCNFPDGLGTCAHLGVEVETSAENCELAGEFAPGSPAHKNLCGLFNAHQQKFNKPGGARRKEWESAGCAGDFPEISACSACEP